MKTKLHATRWLGLALACGTINFAGSSQAAGHARPPSPPLEGGTIYYTGSARDSSGYTVPLWRVNPDGRARTQLGTLPDDSGACVPSVALHGDRRWFLVSQPVGGVYPEVGGTQWARQELFAFSDRGESVQLTDDPTFQPNDWIGTIPLWTVVPGGVVDSRITLLGRRWNTDGTAITEIGLFAIDLDPDLLLPSNNGQNLARTPVLLPISLSVTFEQWDSTVYGNAANVYGYDWSPEGTEVVFSQQGTLYIAGVDGATKRVVLADPAVVAGEPRWSPLSAGAQTQILFASQPAPGEPIAIESIHYDGTGRFTVVPPSTDTKRARWGSTCWSPGGGFFLYADFDRRSISDCDIIRVTADGSSKIILTKDTTAWCYPRGWRLP